MGWANNYIKKLQSGEAVEFRPRGNSMHPHTPSGTLIRVEPVEIANVKKGDIVLCHVAGNDYVHFVTAVNAQGSCQISNARGRVNGWTKRIFGKVTHVG